MAKPNFALHLERIAEKLALRGEKLLDRLDKKFIDEMPDKEDVELNLKVFTGVNGWYDKTVNQQGNILALIKNLDEDDKEFLYNLKVGEAISKKGGIE